MKAFWLATTAAAGLAALWAGPLYAQYPPAVRPPGVPPPAYSPYLNLLRPNNPTYLNYYGLVRPEVEFRSGIYGLQQGVDTNAAGISALNADAAGLPLTGHTTSFMNTSHYFMNRGGQGAAASSAAGPVGGALAAPRTAISPAGGAPATPATHH